MMRKKSGDSELDDGLNVILFTMALTFISSSKRFDSRMVH